jgi:sugar phosphate isomerase/epimerase
MTMQKLSICENTTPSWSFEEDVKNYRRAGIHAMSIGYDKIRHLPIEKVAEILNDAAMQVSSLVLTGFFTLNRKEREDKPFCIADCSHAIELAHKINAEHLLVLSGPPNMINGGIKAAVKQTQESLKKLAPLAEKQGVKLGLEILHPMYLDTWSAITTIEQAMDMIESVNSTHVGIVLDLYHIFWDPKLLEGIKRAAGKIFGVHINDWRFPTRDILLDRVVMGKGIIPAKRIINEIKATGYDGFFDVEILSEELAATDYTVLLDNIKESYAKIVGN